MFTFKKLVWERKIEKEKKKTVKKEARSIDEAPKDERLRKKWKMRKTIIIDLEI